MVVSTTFSVPLSQIIQTHNLHPAYLPHDAADIMIVTSEVSRPGLQLAGFYGFFDQQRIQIVGKSEIAYLQLFTPDELLKCLDRFFSERPKAVVVTSGQEILHEMLAAAQRYECALLTTEEGTSDFLAALIATLSVELAPRVTRHGVLVEVYGEGILLLGESGVGKSETAMELVKRGHRLIADDAVEIRRVSARTLVGSSPKNIRHFMELRGIGIINVRRIFGIGSVKVTEQIDMIIQLEQWDSQKIYDRMGIDTEYIDILGNEVPSLTIPVKPGRNLAIIIEVAAMNHRQKEMGYNSAQELLNRLGIAEDMPGSIPHDDWAPFD